MFVAQGAHAAQVFGRVDADAGGALAQRLEDDAGQLVFVLADNALHGGEGLERVRFVRGLIRVGGAVRRRRDVRFDNGVLERRMKRGHEADADRAEGVAVVAVFERDEAGLAADAAIVPVLNGDFERGFGGAGAVRGEVAMVQAAGGKIGQARGEFHREGMRLVAEDGVLQNACLLANGPDDAGVAVAECDGPPRGDAVECGAAVLVVEVDAFGALERDIGLLFVGIDVRVGMPEMPVVEFLERISPYRHDPLLPPARAGPAARRVRACMPRSGSRPLPDPPPVPPESRYYPRCPRVRKPRRPAGCLP